MQPASHRDSHTHPHSAQTQHTTWHMHCIVIRGDAWLVLLFPCNTRVTASAEQRLFSKGLRSPISPSMRTYSDHEQMHACRPPWELARRASLTPASGSLRKTGRCGQTLVPTTSPLVAAHAAVLGSPSAPQSSSRSSSCSRGSVNRSGCRLRRSPSTSRLHQSTLPVCRSHSSRG